MFGIFDDVVDAVVDTTSSVVSKTVDLGTLGTVSVTKEQVAGLIATGVAVYELSEASGIAVDVIEQFLEE